jgi:hypothetical protein
MTASAARLTAAVAGLLSLESRRKHSLSTCSSAYTVHRILITQTDRGRAPVRGSEFTTKAAELQGDSSELVRSYCACGPWPSCFPRPRFGLRGT